MVTKNTLLTIWSLKNQVNRGGKSPGPLCDNPENVSGILAYRDIPYSRPDDTPRELAEQPSEPSNLGVPGNAAFGTQPWLSAEHQMPVLTPNSSSLYDKTNNNGGRAFEVNGESQDGTGSPEGQSNGPTPNSSNGSDRIHLAPNQTNTGTASGVSSAPRQEFRASPMSPSQNMLNGASMPAEPGTHQNFFAANGYPMPAGISNQQGFAMGTGWADMSNQQSEGVLRVLMNMGPMEAMDLSSWDSGNEPMRG